ncbi:ABC transporter ATP-binding protein [Falsiporphyromonas endometrii]|uniref:ABC transporter ATP-binding protein n=1 Tax=Falsiporphyromonas endometrii TaxID=1387297 RepID=A0ABV9K786_9PORP
MERNLVLKAEHIYKSFDTLEVLKGIDLEVYEAEIVSIVGASGSGKTTLLQILGLLDQPRKGARLIIGGKDVSTLSKNKQAEVRNKDLGFVFQAHQLLPEFTALENVAMPALIQGIKKDVALGEAKRLLKILNLEQRSDHKPNEMSGGERQRVAVARALINKPKIVLADEPSGSLDSKNKEELHQLFFDLRKEMGQSFLIVTHDESLAERCDRMITLSDGVVKAISQRKECE